MREMYLSKKRLEVIRRKLAGRDQNILASLQKCRYLTTGQIQRLHFTGRANHKIAQQAANRNLHKLQGMGLADTLKRRIGGVRAGSSSYVWFLKEPGMRLLQLEDGGFFRKRVFEPSPAFLEHTLAVSEVYLQFTEACVQHRLELLRADFEPDCWRNHQEHGRSAVLKPDLFAVTASGEYEDAWFIEMDLNTEAPCAVLEKCRRYVRYYKSGIEQKQSGVFPLVVWIVPSGTRKKSLQQNIDECRELACKGLFLVITPDELEGLIQKGGAL